MATATERAAIVDALWVACQTHATIAPPSRRVADFTLVDGYAIAAELDARRRRAGDIRAGVKIGFTNTAVWESMGLTDPAPSHGGRSASKSSTATIRIGA